MSEGPSATDTVDRSVDAVSGALDVDPEDVDVGSDETPREALGREIGRRLGRELGSAIGGAIVEIAVSEWRKGKGPRAILARIREYLARVVSKLRGNAELIAALLNFRNTVRSKASDVSEMASPGTGAVTEGAEAATDVAAEAAGKTADAAEGATEEASGAAEKAVESAEGAAGTVQDAAGSVTPGDGDEEAEPEEEAEEEPAPEDLAGLREETLREVLNLLSYDQLQSIAKKRDVKANLDAETMQDRIVETFVEDESSADESDESEASDESDESDE